MNIENWWIILLLLLLLPLLLLSLLMQIRDKGKLWRKKNQKLLRRELYSKERKQQCKRRKSKVKMKIIVKMSMMMKINLINQKILLFQMIVMMILMLWLMKMTIITPQRSRKQVGKLNQKKQRLIRILLQRERLLNKLNQLLMISKIQQAKRV